MTSLANDLTKPRLTPPRVAGGAGQQHRARPPRRHHPLQVGTKWRRYFFFPLKPIKNLEARFCLYNIISSAAAGTLLGTARRRSCCRRRRTTRWWRGPRSGCGGTSADTTTPSTSTPGTRLHRSIINCDSLYYSIF